MKGDGKKKEKKKPSAEPTTLPEFIKYRNDMLEKWGKERVAGPKIAEKPIKVTMPDGNVKDATAGKTTPNDIATAISKSLAEASIIAKVII